MQTQINIVELIQGNFAKGHKTKEQHKTAFLKKSAVQLLLQANQQISQQKYKQAKDLIISATNLCREIDHPDQYTRKLLELCYEQTTIIDRESTKKRRKQRRLDTYDRIIFEQSHSVVILPFDKVHGQFVLSDQQQQYMDLEDDANRLRFNQEIQFQASKLNAIVFDYNNTEHFSSLAHMYDIYKTQLYIAAMLVILLLVTLFIWAQILGQLSKSFDQNTAQILAVAIPSSAFICPLLMIYLRQHRDKNPKVYQRRLEEELDKINQTNAFRCRNLCIILRENDPIRYLESKFG